MPSRLLKSRPQFIPNRRHHGIENEPAYLDAASDANLRIKLAPASNGAMNTYNRNGAALNSNPDPYANAGSSLNRTPRAPPTIRTVPSFEAASEDSSSESPSARNSGFSSSVHSNVSGASYVSLLPPAHSGSTVRLKTQSHQQDLSSRYQCEGSQMSSSDATVTGKENAADHRMSLQVPEATPVEEQSSFARESSPQWDGAVGKAGLGKTGRVINKLVSDNEALKRDIKIERMKAEESKQAAKLVEDKMERMVSDYESRLLEANVTKTLLSRKERQVEHLQSAVELEKKRTADAQERERTWREEMEKGRRDTKIQVEEANTQAALMEGRYNAISSHWRDQGEEVKLAMTNLNGRILTLVDERRSDDRKIGILRDLCDQQDGNIRDLKRQNEEINQQFESYKREQEAALRDIKKAAGEREEEQSRTIEETKQVLAKLKWALNVKREVKGAQ
ncbi:Uu.00g009850.m01.CDS01 [Anthostomella pinea]|uniref:Uu.00g009850.m01.CDS01 n=1 Tax=Anthostomella pinea TaxID=933095 RepID=A0AAI8VRQ2_9PEZI|nr:Uu.00g009850.m01.CDS01 [Anthostomella pinea]